MQSGFITKYYLIIISLLTLLLGSCVNNGDEPVTPTPNPEKPVDLTVNNLVGKWEQYYFTKQIVAEHLNLNHTYRFTESDGFTVTFNRDGSYSEHNVFDMETIKGTYKIGKRDSGSTKDDLITLEYMGKAVNGQDSPVVNKVYVPHLKEGSFAYYHSYHGVAHQNEFKVEDIRYFRNPEINPGYTGGFNKVELSEDYVIGLWEFYRYEMRVNNNVYTVYADGDNIKGDVDNDLTKKAAENMLEQYRFRIENDSLTFYQFKKGETIAERRGFVKVEEDVIYFLWEGWVEKKTTDENGVVTVDKEYVIDAYKWWIKKRETDNKNRPVMVDYDRYRFKDDVLQDREENSFYRKIETQKSVKSYAYNEEILVKPVASAHTNLSVLKPKFR